jgi:hypothetical protein
MEVAPYAGRSSRPNLIQRIIDHKRDIAGVGAALLGTTVTYYLLAALMRPKPPAEEPLPPASYEAPPKKNPPIVKVVPGGETFAFDPSQKIPQYCRRRLYKDPYGVIRSQVICEVPGLG